MITCKEFPNEVFSTVEERNKKLKENKHLLITQKKTQTKFSDSFDYSSVLVDKKIGAEKSEGEATDKNNLKVIAVINTTNILDSHGDVHLKGIWNKTVRENKNMLHLNQHRQTFEDIITDDVKASVKKYSWKELGYNADGETEALVFTSNISKERHPYMFEQYSKGRVKQHSVGMRYVKMDLAINSNSEWFKEEKENWDKYIDEIINKEDAEKEGYFWAVSEAKALEGSAVVFGSNPITPTLAVKQKNEPLENTQETETEPSLDTHENKKSIYTNLI